jgi:hypothetical protein
VLDPNPDRERMELRPIMDRDQSGPMRRSAGRREAAAAWGAEAGQHRNHSQIETRRIRQP